jgi:hypothetical protein
LAPGPAAARLPIDDTRIREIMELAPPSHLLREFPASERAREHDVTKRGRRSIASCTAPTIGCSSSSAPAPSTTTTPRSTTRRACPRSGASSPPISSS